MLTQHEKVLRTLLILDSLRGEDSTGIAEVAKFKGAEVTVAKALGNPFNLFETRAYEEALRGAHRAIIGHNRYATSGGVSRRTAHPFDFETLVGVHNGTLTNKHALINPHRFTVDSENLYHHIEENGLDDAIQTADGAWSLVWWDKERDTLNFLRNKERPMWICHTADPKKGVITNEALFFASEAWMLEQACWKAGVPYSEPYMTEVDTHYAFRILDGGILQKPVLRNMPEKVAKVLPCLPPPQQQVLALAGRRDRPVLTLAKTDTTPPIIAYAGEDRQYLQVKRRPFELLSDKVDAHGEDYIECLDPLAPYKEIRLYPLSTDKELWDQIGSYVVGDIHHAVSIASTPGKVYYRIKSDNVELVEAEKRVKFSPGTGTANKEQWDRMKLTCAWCSSPLAFGENNRFTHEYECFCPDCAEDKEINTLVKFVHN